MAHAAGGRLLVTSFDEDALLVEVAGGRIVDRGSGRDAAATTDGLVLSGLDEIRSSTADRGWVTDVPTGDRPALWLDADDDVVVALVGWGQPPTRD